MAKFESYQQGTPSYVELITPDQQAAKAFYGSLFGWDIAEVPVGDQGVYLPATIDGDSVAGISGQMPGLEGHPAFWGVYLAVDDVDATTAKVVPAGGTVEAAPFDVMELGRMSSIKDPTGARVNLWQAKDSIGSVRANEAGTTIWNELVTPDVAAALPFYADVLGITAETMSMGEGREYTTLKVGGSTVGGAVPPPMAELPPHWNVYFNVADADATLARALELGGRALVPAFDAPGVGRMAMLADGQGGIFWVMSAPARDEIG